MIQNKMIFAIDWEKFGWSVKACSDAAGSYRKLVELHPSISVAMVSRAVNASDSHPVSAASFLHLCACLDLDVWQFYLRKKTRQLRFEKVRSFKDIVRNQTVSASVSREMLVNGKKPVWIGSWPDFAAVPQSEKAHVEREAVRDNKP